MSKPTNKPRFNPWLLWGGFILLFVIINYTSSGGLGNSKELPISKFNEILEKGQVERVVFNRSSAKVFLTEEAKKQDEQSKAPNNVFAQFQEPSHFVVDIANVELFEKNLNSKDYIDLAKQYFDSRINGTVDQIDVKNAYLNKKKYNLSDLQNIYSKIDLNKKNIVVMSHAFSDAPHVGEGLLFYDYYDFLEKTLIRLNNNENVNSFVKAHPSSYMWNEKGAVEELIEKNRLENIYILPSDFNTSSVLDIADYIVTAKGTAGLEFSCSGIPAITAGKGYYYGFGIDIEF